MSNSGFPVEWERAYRDSGYLSDPIPGLALALASPIIWNKLPEGTVLSRAEQDYMDQLHAWGMETGVGIVAYGPFSRTGFVGIGLPVSHAVAEAPDTTLLRIVAQTSFTRYCDLILLELGDLPSLSPRELDVLIRIAEGKSKLVIANELEVSKDTVDTYFRRIYSKLDVSDRGAAVAAAVARGAVSLTDMRLSPEMIRRQPPGTVTED